MELLKNDVAEKRILYNYDFRFITLIGTLSFEVKSPILKDMEDLVHDMINIFLKYDDHEIPFIETFKKNTLDFREKIDLLTNKYKVIIPQINGLPAFFRKLKEDEPFIFSPNTKLNEEKKIKLHNYLLASSENKSFEEIEKRTADLLGDLFKKYQIKSFGDTRLVIGSSSGNKRICRFCNNKENITFSNKAHAISEALGNKTLTLLEECDECNFEYSKTIEPHIIEYLSLFRTIYDIKGKGGAKQFKGENFNLIKDGDVKLTFNNINERPKDLSLPYEIKLESKNHIILQNVYKCFCKYFLSIIDSSELKNFKATIDWINGKTDTKKLPEVGEMVSYENFTTQPKLITYIRKDKNQSLPYAVGMFYFTCKVYAFVIPFSSKDTKKFINKKVFKKYWDTFEFDKKSKNWSMMDYSDIKPKKFIMNLNFHLDNQSQPS